MATLIGILSFLLAPYHSIVGVGVGPSIISAPKGSLKSPVPEACFESRPSLARGSGYMFQFRFDL